MPDSTPITQLGLDATQIARLSAPAKLLVKIDLVSMAHKKETANTKNLSITDIFSIEEAFRDFRPVATHMGNVSCCTCTPCCSCSAAAIGVGSE
jgi:hypothetical protein